MKRITLMSTVLVVFATLLAPAPVARAGGSLDTGALARRYADLRRQGVSGAALQATVEREFGLRLHPGATLTASGPSNPADVLVDQPSVGGGEGDSPYVMVGHMRWNNCSGRGCWEKDRGSNGAGDHGGPDGFAIQTARPIQRRSTAMFRTDSCGRKLPPDQPNKENTYGTGFKIQDDSDGCWNWKEATIVVQFDFVDGGGYCTGKLWSVTSRFTHTWDTSALKNITISSTGIQFEWNDSPHYYEVLPTRPWTSDNDGGCK
jgi:hypothetical protein